MFSGLLDPLVEDFLRVMVFLPDTPNPELTLAQRRLSFLLVMPALLAFLAACPSGEGTLDLSDVPDGEYGVAYDGQIRVLDYTGPVRLTLTTNTNLRLSFEIVWSEFCHN